MTPPAIDQSPRPHVALPRVAARWWLLAVLIAMAWDRAAYLRLSAVGREAVLRFEAEDWYRALRILGYAPTWIVVALLFVLVAGPAAGRRALNILACALLSGVAAEALKVVFGRLRPEDTGGWYAFFGPIERFAEWSDLGLPSSHAAVAFGGAIALARLFPAAAVVLLPLALGCGITRVVSGAHFLSDVVGGAWVAYACCGLLPPPPPPPGPAAPPNPGPTA